MKRGKPLTSAQIRSARALIRWRAQDLARGVCGWCCNHPTGRTREQRNSDAAANDLAIRHALEAAGIEFIDENGGGPGVRLKKPHKKRT